MSVAARNLSIVNLYAPQISGTSHVNKLELFAKDYSTVTVSNTVYESLTEEKDDGSYITFQ